MTDARDRFLARLAAWRARASSLVPGKADRPAGWEARFWSKVDRGTPDACWPWTAGTRKGGYGAFHRERSRVFAHHAAYESHHRVRLLPDTVVMHSCDRPSCCNPRHLIMADQAANVHDLWAKGRGKPRRGERHHGARLTANDVIAMRKRGVAGEPIRSIAASFGVSRRHTWGILAGEAWKHVPRALHPARAPEASR